MVHQYERNGFPIVLNTCSGGCAANAYHKTGTNRGVYEDGCEFFRKRIECAIMIQVAKDAIRRKA